jgi:hypothetical protein
MKYCVKGRQEDKSTLPESEKGLKDVGGPVGD